MDNVFLSHGLFTIRELLQFSLLSAYSQPLTFPIYLHFLFGVNFLATFHAGPTRWPYDMLAIPRAATLAITLLCVKTGNLLLYILASNN